MAPVRDLPLKAKSKREPLFTLSCQNNNRCYKPKAQLSYDDRDLIFMEFFKNHMMGHVICLTQDGYIGIGTGALLYDDIVVVPLGCDTPILLRPYGTKGEYLFIGSVYIHGYMHGKAVRELNSGRRKLTKFVLR